LKQNVFLEPKEWLIGRKMNTAYKMMFGIYNRDIKYGSYFGSPIPGSIGIKTMTDEQRVKIGLKLLILDILSAHSILFYQNIVVLVSRFLCECIDNGSQIL
jgi:hypothetical protein